VLRNTAANAATVSSNIPTCPSIWHCAWLARFVHERAAPSLVSFFLHGRILYFSDIPGVSGGSVGDSCGNVRGVGGVPWSSGFSGCGSTRLGSQPPLRAVILPQAPADDMMTVLQMQHQVALMCFQVQRLCFDYTKKL
jgi:hypothetical protein